jgi:hypoxanthine phosphoribosyltransferase
MFMHKDIVRILVAEEDIKRRVGELGKQISADYVGKEIVVVGILKGAVLFFADLVRCIEVPMQFDFMSISSYEDSHKSSGIVRIIKDLDINIKDKHVLIIEDIVDSGLTLYNLVELLRSRDPASIRTCCLLDKACRRDCEIWPDYTGFEIENEYVVGYGLDYAQKLRELKYIGVLDPRVYANEDK